MVDGLKVESGEGCLVGRDEEREWMVVVCVERLKG